MSTVDLWAGGLMLLAGPEGAAWTEAAARVAGPPLKPYQVADGVAPPGSALLGDPERRWATAFGVTASGAVLIRPDGFVAWRATESAGSRTDAVLGEALRAVLRGQAGKSLVRESW
jgi:putative polyketide hydroxylase